MIDEKIETGQKRILLGLHDLEGRKMLKIISEDYGYVVDIFNNLEEAFSLAQENNYDICYMDANFNKLNSRDISSSVSVFEIFKDRIGKGLTKFLAVSCNDDALVAAKIQGIPVEDKYNVNFEDLFK